LEGYSILRYRLGVLIMSFSFNPSIPYYYQIKEDILKKIEDGIFNVGDQLPSEHEFVQEYGVSRPTIRQAIVQLVQEGVLVRGRGKGTFVSQPLITSNAQLFTTFAEAMHDKGVQQRAKLIEVKRIQASEKIAADLEIPAGDDVYEIVRLRMGNNEPLVIRTMQISAKLYPDFLEEDLETEPLYSIFQRKYGFILGNAVQSFQAVTATKLESSLLRIEVGAPLMLWQGVTYTAQKVPIERVKALYRGDRFRFMIKQGRNVDTLSTFNETGMGILDGVNGGVW
jgi:GntR family transcriptional regulator